MAKLSKLYVISNKDKQNIIEKIIISNKCNLIYTYHGIGGASKQTLKLLGLLNNDKCVVVGIVRDDKIKQIMKILNEKLNTNNKVNSIILSVPIKSVIGSNSYKFLSNDFGGNK